MLPESLVKFMGCSTRQQGVTSLNALLLVALLGKMLPTSHVGSVTGEHYGSS